MRRDYIAPYRRHLDTCEHRAKGKDFTLCECPIWGYGYVAGQPFRRSLQTADWPRALRRIEILLNGGDLAPEPRSLTIHAALDAFFADAKARHLKPSTIRSYHYTLDPLGDALGGRQLAALDVDALSRFREGRKVKPKTARKEIEHLRAFCAFCVDRGWMASNPAKKVKPPRADYVSTLPFTEDEVSRLLDACGRMRAMHREDLRYVRQRARALVLVLLYSGLRISDVAVLERSAISSSGHLLLQQIKPGVPVRLLLNRDAIEALEALPAPGGNPRYYFWTGRGSPKSCRGSLARTIYRLGELAGVKAHPHRFRDHFAVELLTNGADIRTVQLLLGHRSVKTTEKHYAHFVAAHQKILDSAAATLDFSQRKPRRPLLVKPLKHRSRHAK